MESNRGLRRFVNLSLRLKLYVSLGVLVFGLLVVGGTGIAGGTITRRLVDRSLTRQRNLAGLAAGVNSKLLAIQNEAFEFCTIWEINGFEWRVSFDDARETYLDPIQRQLDYVHKSIDQMLVLECEGQARSSLENLGVMVDAYEITLLAVADDMEALGYSESGERGQLRGAVKEIESRLQALDIESLDNTLVEIRWHESAYFNQPSHLDIRLTREAVHKLQEQISTLDDAQLLPAERDELIALLEEYDEHFLAATALNSQLQTIQPRLISQSDAAGALAKTIFEVQQDKFEKVVSQLEGQQSVFAAVIVGLTLLTTFVGGIIAYWITERIVRSMQTLGEAATQLAAGDLHVRAKIYGRDEIGVTALAFNTMAGRLQELLTELERMVQERTRDLGKTTTDLAARTLELEQAHSRQMEANRELEESVRQGQHRAAMLQSSAQVSRAIAQIRDLDELLPLVTQLISEHFGFYHVGIFLIDKAGRYAVLRAANSEGGKRMLARGHKLGVGAEGIVGFVTRTGQARISLDVGADAVYFNNPDLSNTRSEMALPLIIGDEIIGALDVQSIEPSAFDQEDIAMLSTLADQVAIALNNAQLFQQTQDALEEVRQAQRFYFQQEWAQFVQQKPKLNYEYTLSGIQPLGDAPLPEADEAFERDEIVTVGADSPSGVPALAAPIKVRDQVIGVLDLQETDQERVWSDQEIALVRSVADQIGQAIEGARLFEETQKRALQEARIRQVTEKIYARTDIEGILRATVTELARIISDSKVYVRLGVFESSDF